MDEQDRQDLPFGVTIDGVTGQVYVTQHSLEGRRPGKTLAGCGATGMRYLAKVRPEGPTHAPHPNGSFAIERQRSSLAIVT